MPNKDLTAKLVLGSGYDPWYNLAVEEYLLEKLTEGEIILYLWQNDNTVVIGRNQNAWQECRVGKLEDNGGKMARRLSGGGAVFHDRGNLNYTLIMPKKVYDLEEQLTVVIDALNDLGIAAQFSGRNDIVCQGKKISGNAFYYGAKGAYIHGTVLVDSDLDKLSSYLKVSEAKIKSKGIDSVTARVMNLTAVDEQLSIEDVQKSIQSNFRELYNEGQPLSRIEIKDNKRIQELYDKYSSWEWRFGENPECDISFNTRFEWGEVEFNFKLTAGNIEEAVLYSDAMYGDLIGRIADCLTGQPFKLSSILQLVEEVLADYQFPSPMRGQKITQEFLEWLESELKEIVY